MGTWEAISWNIARAGGFTAYILLMLSVVVGLALTMQWQSASKWPRLLNSELHNFLTLLALIFTSIHVLAVWIDPFTNFGWEEVFLPFVSHYRPIWMALGIIAFYLGIAIGISTWIRPLIGYAWWRKLHVLSLVVYALVTLHGIGNGSDTRFWWAVVIYVTSIILVGGLICWRALKPVQKQGRSHPVLAALSGLAVLASLAWMVLGPLQPALGASQGASGGSSKAQSAQPSVPGSRAPSQVIPPTNANTNGDPFATPFTASLQGTLNQSAPDARGAETLQMDTTLGDGAQGKLVIILKGQQASGEDGSGALTITSSQVTLSNGSAPLYNGQLTDLRATRVWRMSAVLNKAGSARQGQLQMLIEMRVSSDGQISGMVQGAPASSSGGIQPAPVQTTPTPSNSTQV